MVKETFSFPQPICEINWCQVMNSLRLTPKGQLLDSEWDIIFLHWTVSVFDQFGYLAWNTVISPELLWTFHRDRPDKPCYCSISLVNTSETYFVILSEKSAADFQWRERLVQEGVTWNGILQTRKALFPWITRFE